MIEKNNLLFQRFERIMKHYGFKSINDFAINGLGYSSSEKISRLKRGGKPSFEILEDVSNKFEDLSLNWLVTGEGEMNAADSQNVLREPSIEYNSKSAGTPFYNLPVTAGDNYNIVASEDSLAGYVDIPGVKVEAYFPVIGCSMEPIVYQGSYVGVNKVDIWNDNPIINPSKIFFIITSDERMIKHIEYNNGDEHINCISPNYPSFKLPVTEIKALYRVDVIIKFP